MRKGIENMIKFGTGGWRAIIGDEFIKSNIVTLAQAVADEINDRGCGERGIVIGYDRRFLSDRAAQWIAEVMAANRVTVHYINRISPTPLVMYGVKTLDTLYGMAVTASHNPAEYNGVKIFTVGGRDADQATTDAFEARISAGVKVKSMDFDKGVADGHIRLTDLYNAYLDSIISMINMDVIRMRRMRILLDPMFGVSKTALQTVLITARCDVDIINDRHDTLFGGKLPSPSAHTLTKLANMVVDEGYDLGIGTDGDADRIGIIDEKGVFVHPNEILMLLYYYLLKYKGWRGDVVRNIATTHVLDRIAQDFGQTCHEVPVGFKHISAKMEETDAVIGGESSGGLTIRGHIRGKDGIFASALLVEMICATGKHLSELLEEIYGKYGKCEMAEFDTRFTAEKKKQLENLLFEQKKVPDFGIPVEKASYLDGLKVYFQNGGWIIARFSGTEPLIRIFCEMENMNLAQQMIDVMRTFLEL